MRPTTYSNELYHHGVKGQRWGVRRYRNEDGSLTPAGKKHEARMEKYRQRELKSLDRSYTRREARADRKVEKAEAKYEKWLAKNKDEQGRVAFGPLANQMTKLRSKQQRASIIKGMHALERSRVEKMTTDELAKEIKSVNAKRATDAALLALGVVTIPTTSMNYKTQLRTDALGRSAIVREANRKHWDGYSNAYVAKRHRKLIGPMYVE